MVKKKDFRAAYLHRGFAFHEPGGIKPEEAIFFTKTHISQQAASTNGDESLPSPIAPL